MARFDMDIDELHTYTPQVVEPEDFDEFWARTLAENPFDPYSVSFEPVEVPLTTVHVWDVTFPGYGNHPIRAWLTVPADAEWPLPTVVQFNGYGGGRGLPFQHLHWASAGYAHLFMDSRGQGGTWGHGGETGDPVGSPSSADQGFMTRGIENPESYYYRRLYVDAHHAVEAAAVLPQVDAERIAVTGGSQGGALTIAAASLNPRVKAAMPDVPFLTFFRRAIGMTDAMPYAEVARYLSVFRDRVERAFETLDYFDCVNLGKRATCPAIFSTALLDQICPPSTVFAARNLWGSEETPEINVYDFNGHEGGELYQWRAQVEWLTERI